MDNASGNELCWSVNSIPLLAVLTRHEGRGLVKNGALFLAIGFTLAGAVVWQESGDAKSILFMAGACVAIFFLICLLFLLVAAGMKVIGLGYEYRLDSQTFAYAMTGGVRYLLAPLSVVAAVGAPLSAPAAAMALGSVSGQASWAAMRALGARLETDDRGHFIVIRGTGPASGGEDAMPTIYIFCGTEDRVAQVSSFIAARLT